MCKWYYKYRLSSEFAQKWNDHLTPVGGPDPIFYQFVTDAVMKVLIKSHVLVTTEHRESVVTLDYEEQNTICYTAGYVLRGLWTKINHSSYPLKYELLLCLEELKEDGVMFVMFLSCLYISKDDAAKAAPLTHSLYCEGKVRECKEKSYFDGRR